jgi:cyclomaltodextrinase / maltogenic alpha-amylase / neopullulanase
MSIRPPQRVKIERPALIPDCCVEVLGEMCDWLNPLPMDSSGVELSLPVGVYCYKLRVDGRWQLDPGNARTRTAIDGNQNNVLSVGGGAEPLLFAPTAPFLCEESDRDVRITALLRKGHGSLLRVRCLWDDESHVAGDTRVMTLAFEEPEHLVLVTRIPRCGNNLRLRFDDDSGGRVFSATDGADEFEVRVEDLPLPPWWKQGVIYTILIDRFRPRLDSPSWEHDPATSRAVGGHLAGIRRSLPYLRDLGVTILYLTPVHLAASSHRYDVVDPFLVDPTLGGAEELRNLVQDVHRAGMRILLDFSFSHVGDGFPEWSEVREEGPAARHAGWFQWREGGVVHYGTRSDAPLLNLHHPEVRALVLKAARHWAGFDVDGFRLDAAAEVPIDLAIDVRRELLKLRPDALVVGELIPQHAWRWVCSGAIDVAMDFGFHHAVTQWLAWGTIRAEELVARMAANELARGVSASRSVRFVSTHDHPRLDTYAQLGGRGSRAVLGLVLAMTWPGVPALLYGEELGLAATRARSPEDVWPDRMPMPWLDQGFGQSRQALVRSLLTLRRRQHALISGPCEVVHASGDTLIFQRGDPSAPIWIALHAGDTEVRVQISGGNAEATELFLVGRAEVRGDEVVLGPYSCLVWRWPVLAK